MEKAAYNRRFCEMAGTVKARAAVLGITVGGSPNGDAVDRHFAKSLGQYTWLMKYRIYNIKL
jgi:hypothetical protein